MTTPLSPQPADAIFAAIRRALRNVHTSLPAVVIAYDPLTASAEVSVTVQVEVAPGEWQPLLPLSDVPVCWPGGSLGSIEGTLAPGDPVLLVFSEHDPSQWLATGVPAQPPPIVARHGMFAYAIPGGRPDTIPAPVSGVFCGATGVDIGARVGTQPVALATSLFTLLSSACDAAILAAFPNDGGRAAFGAFKAALGAGAAGAIAVRARAI